MTIFNFQKYRHIEAPGWKLGWAWAKREIIWSMLGAQTVEQGDCSKFKGDIPHCCKKDPTVVDLLPSAPYNQRMENCCRGGVLSSWVQDHANAVTSFQLTVGQSGTSNKTVKAPMNFTLKAPGPGYTCGPTRFDKPSKFRTPDKRRVTQALSTFLVFALIFFQLLTIECVYFLLSSFTWLWKRIPILFSSFKLILYFLPSNLLSLQL